jgi:hypothetical protein
MIVVAALGSDAGDVARRSIARWALSLGRHPAALDIGCGEDPSHPSAAVDLSPVDAPHIPLVELPSAPERLKDEPAEVLAAVLDRLRRHESAADLLVVRISPRCRMALMRAAFLGGGLVVPVEDSYDVLYEAFQLSRETLENFIDLQVWPLPRDESALRRYQAMMREVLDTETGHLEEPGDPGAALLEGLAAPPEEGFLVSLIDPETPNPPAQLLRIGSLPV